MNQWIVNKYGFINFWLFDDEQITTFNGNLLLNGENGSGKSVTLQSFIPMILDGNSNSNRISTEGDNSRKIEWYLLYGDKEQAVSYLYAEFVKESMGEKKYVTYGIGFKITKGQARPLKWYFKIDDLRVGEDIKLYKKENGQKFIHEKRELKKVLESNSEGKYTIFETREEYKTDVNTTLFGFNNIDEFEETLNLIVELRKPNIKDSNGFDPKFIYEILNKSLKPLPESDLMTMSESFENIEKISNDLKSIENQNRAITAIEEKYKRYNETVLKERVDLFLKSHNSLSKAESEKSEREQNLTRSKEMVEKSVIKLEKLEQEKKNKLSRKIELESNREFKDIQNSYESVNNRLHDLELKSKNLKQSFEKLKMQINRNDEEISVKLRESENGLKQLEKSVESIKKIREELKFESIVEFDDILSKDKKLELSVVEKEFDEFEKKIREILNILKEKQSEEESRKRENDSLSETEESYYKNGQSYKEKIEELTSLKEEFMERVHSLKDSMRELYFSKEVTGDMEEILYSNEERAERDKIVNRLSEEMGKVSKHHLSEKVKKQEKKREIESKIKEIEKNIESIRAEKDVEFELKEEFLNERKKIASGSFIEFYKGIKFRNGVDEEIKNSIEKAFIDIGLINAVITKENIETICDKFLISTAEKTNNLTEYLEVEDCAVFRESIEKILKSISVLESEDVYITKNGKYRIGVITGQSSKEYSSKYIGIETRKKLKEEIIKNLEQEKKGEERVLYAINSEIEDIEEKEETLKKEFREFEKEVDKFEFGKVNREIAEIVFNRKRLKDEIDKRREKIKKIDEKIEKLKKEIENIVAVKRIYIADLSKAEEHINRFKVEFERTKGNYRDLIRIRETIETLENIRENLNQQSSENLKEKRVIESELKECLDKKKLYEEKLENQEYKDFLREIEQLNLRINIDIPNEMRELDRTIGNRKESIRTTEIEIEKAREVINNLKKEYEILNYLLEIELHEDFLNLKEEFKEIESKQRLKERLRKRVDSYGTKDEVYAELATVLNREERTLGAYHLSLKNYIYNDEKFGSSYKEYISSRMVITGVIEGKEVKFDFISSRNREHLEATKDLLDDEERKFFEDFLFNEIGRGINRRVKESEEWVEKIDEIMQITPTSSGKKYKLSWLAKTVDQSDGIKADSFVAILGNRHSKDGERIKGYFKNRMNQLKNENRDKNNPVSNYELIKEVLDYRNWFEFKLDVLESGDTKWKPLTKARLNSFSGGEKVMAVYIPIFSALYARFKNAREDSLKIVAMDEAFSVVDDDNIEKMFNILENLGMNYLLASQKLTGMYRTVKNLAIVHIENPVSKQLVEPKDGYITLIRYLWNGKERAKDMREAVVTLF